MYESRLSPIYLRYSGRSRPSDSGGSGQPDPEIIGGDGGGGLQKIFFRSFGPHFGRKMGRGGAGRKSSEILQTIVYKSLSNFANLWSHIFVSFQQIKFKICIFANLKALLLAVSQSRVEKKRGTDIKEPSTVFTVRMSRKLTGVQLPEACRATKTRSASTATGNFCSHMSQQCSSSKYYNVKPFISPYFSTMYFSETERKKN